MTRFAGALSRAAPLALVAFPRRGRVGARVRSMERAADRAHGVAARTIPLRRAGPGALVVTTHRVTITAHRGVALRRKGGALVLVGRAAP